MEMKILLSEISLPLELLLRMETSYTSGDKYSLCVFCRLTFQSAIVTSASSLILEREEGMLDRTYVAG